MILKLQSLLFSEMEVPSSEEILQCMSSSLSQIKWRLKASSKRRLDIGCLRSFYIEWSQSVRFGLMDLSEFPLSVRDKPLKVLNFRLYYDDLSFTYVLAALCTGMRPVVMIDYGGKLPELQTRLLSLLELLQEVSLSTFSSSNITTWVSCFCSCCLCPLGFTSFQRSDGYGYRGYDLPDQWKNTAQLAEFWTWIVLPRLGTRSSTGCSSYKSFSICFSGWTDLTLAFVLFKMVEQSK